MLTLSSFTAKVFVIGYISFNFVIKFLELFNIMRFLCLGVADIGEGVEQRFLYKASKRT
jgi:hypothetical protein